MGVAIDGDYAVVWFGHDSDPAGPVPATDTDTPEIEATYAGLTLAARKEDRVRGETNIRLRRRSKRN